MQGVAFVSQLLFLVISYHVGFYTSTGYLRCLQVIYLVVVVAVDRSELSADKSIALTLAMTSRLCSFAIWEPSVLYRYSPDFKKL